MASQDATRGPEYLTITLTGRAPVRIRREDWPILARARQPYGDGVRRQRECALTVRQHADGRAVVYGVYSSEVPGEHDVRGGAVVPADGNLAAAIRQVAADMAAADPEAASVWARLGREATADLPAEYI